MRILVWLYLAMPTVPLPRVLSGEALGLIEQESRRVQEEVQGQQ